MTVRIDPPFKVVRRISKGVDPDTVSLKRLRDVVAGRDTSFRRSRAMTLLLASDFPNKHRDFQVVLENEEEASEIRYLAAINLGKINTPVALGILHNNLQVRDERVMVGVVKMIGRIGGKPELEAISKVRERTTGFATSQADFAMALIAHRLGLAGSELPVPEDKAYLDLADGYARPFQIIQADDIDAEFCLRCLADRPFGIELSEQPVYQVRCGRRVLILLFNRDFTGQDAIYKLRARKSILGIIASWSEETKLYSSAYLVLTRPIQSSDRVHILICRPDGEVPFGGLAQVERNQAAFLIRAVSRPGAFGFQMEGLFQGGRIEVKTALSTFFVQVEKRQPIKGRGPDIVEQHGLRT